MTHSLELYASIASVTTKKKLLWTRSSVLTLLIYTSQWHCQINRNSSQYTTNRVQ